MIAVAISGFALSVASSPQISPGYLSAAAVMMGIGISAMHYAGMAAIEIEPMVTYELDLLLASVGIAIGASFAALWLFFKLRHGRSLGMHMARAGAAFVMGLAITTAVVAAAVLSIATILLILDARNDAQAGEGRLGDAM